MEDPPTRMTRHVAKNGGIRRATAEEAAAVWSGLARGVWSMIDRVDDKRGHRFVLARFIGENEPLHWHRLTARELLVVQAVAAGRTNPQIASILGVSVPTVAGHLRAARTKLGRVSRLALIKLWRLHSAAELAPAP